MSSAADRNLPSAPRTTASRTNHWNEVYRAKTFSELSWHQEEPALSLKLIGEVAAPGGQVIDVGGGASGLAGRLVEAGYAVTVLDISETALAQARARIGRAAEHVHWIVGDVTALKDVGRRHVWHDRAVFHFLTDERDRRQYAALAARTLPRGGHMIVATFALEGPEKCSGLFVERYGPDQMAAAMGCDFRLEKAVEESHTTPWGKPQRFMYAVLERL